MQELLSASLTPSSVPTYRRAWKRFKEFQLGVFHSQNASLPIAPATLALFVAYLFANHYAISTVNTYVSALGYYHRLAGLQDPTKTFYITEMLKGYGRINRTLDSRLPITLPILVRIMQVSPTVCASQYQSYMFQAMCSMAFFGFLGIGEITVTKPQSIHSNLLYLSHVTRQFGSKGEVVSLVVTFTNYKHNTNRNAFSLILHRQLHACPVQSFLDYVTVRGSENGPLFINKDGSPVLRSYFGKVLCSVIRVCGLDSDRYKGHSFRIGAATYAAEQGHSDTQIRHMGRWKSDAFKKYIRISSLKSIC